MCKNGIAKKRNLLDQKDETYPKYQTKEWHVINDRNNGSYPYGNGNDKGIKIDTGMVKHLLCDYADAYILVTGNLTVENVAAHNVPNTKTAFKSSHPFIKCKIHLNDVHVGDADNLDIIMNMYNLIEYSNGYSDSTASLYHFKRQEPLADNADLTVDGSSSFKYKSGLLDNATSENGNAVWKNTFHLSVDH